MTDQLDIALPAGPAPRSSRHDIECGCQLELEPDGPAWLIATCAEHEGRVALFEARVAQQLGYELDALVAEACGGHRVKRIRPADPYQR